MATNCPQCNKPIEHDDPFCSKCGAKLPQQPKDKDQEIAELKRALAQEKSKTGVLEDELKRQGHHKGRIALILLILALIIAGIAVAVNLGHPRTPYYATNQNMATGAATPDTILPTTEEPAPADTEAAQTQTAGDPLPSTESTSPADTSSNAPKETASFIPQSNTVQQDDSQPEIITMGSYPQGSNGEVAPIEWLIIARRDDMALCLSRLALDVKPYHHFKVKTSWKDCSLREWLNDEFYERSFTPQEKILIQKMRVPNVNRGTADSNSYDYICLLSVEEVDALLKFRENRLCQPSAYAMAQEHDDDHHQYCSWWLRTICPSGDEAVTVSKNGHIDNDGDDVNEDDNYVRPACVITLSKK